MLPTLALLAASAVRADNWAVLVAGSNGYSNYRHQADVCHAYQILIKNGINPDNIITMSYGDAAPSSENPFPNQLFNKPADGEGYDVNKGCNLDYKADDVNSENFVKVLTGDASAGGKVLKSTSEDNVFINFVDHGGVGVIAFPGMKLFHADDLISTLKTMNEKNMYKELVFYMEACESGSMFEGLLPDDIKIYATTAANAKESSWGTYCGTAAKVNGKNLNTCLGDLYSVNWMEDADQDTPGETLDAQFNKVKVETNKSHVQQFGETDMGSDKAASFWGKVSQRSIRGGKNATVQSADVKISSAVSSRDTKLHMLHSQYLASEAGSFDRTRLAKSLVDEIQSREYADKVFTEVAAQALALAGRKDKLDIVGGYSKPRLFQCHKKAVAAVEQQCGKFTDYSFQYMRVLVNLCENLQTHEHIVKAVKNVCA